MIPSHDHRAIDGDISAAMAMAVAQTDPQVLVCMAEEADAIDRRMRAELARMAELRTTIRVSLEARLTVGELVQAPSGRIAHLADDLADGSATVRIDALEEMAGELPERLRPTTRAVYPGVGDIRKALADREITREQAAALIAEPGRRLGLRWRTLDTGGLAA